MQRARHPDRHQHRGEEIHRGEMDFRWNTLAPPPRRIDTATGHHDLTERRSRFVRTKAGGQRTIFCLYVSKIQHSDQNSLRTFVSITSHFAWQQSFRTECPLWVKSRHWGKSEQCPLYPRKRTLPALFMSTRPSPLWRCASMAVTAGRSFRHRFFWFRTGGALRLRGPLCASDAVWLRFRWRTLLVRRSANWRYGSDCGLRW